MNREYVDATLHDLVTGTASKPFQYRILVPWLGYKVWKTSNFIRSFIPHPLGFFKFIEFVSVFLLVISFRYYLSLFMSVKKMTYILVFFIYFVLVYTYILPRFAPLWYPYDMPSILFFTLGLILIFKKRWFSYYIVFVLGTFNRETTCFLTIVYLLTNMGRTPLRKVVLHTLGQVVLWSMVKYYLFLKFPSSSGRIIFENHFQENLEFVLDIRNLPFLLSFLGYTWIPSIIFINRVDNWFLKRSSLVIIPYILGMFFVANVYEFRVYGELAPVLLPFFLVIVENLFKE